MKLSVVIPALNEEKGIGAVIKQIPIAKLNDLGYEVEVIVVDNNCTDKTPEIATSLGARVVKQPIPGYGSAYKMGFDMATGDIIATGDADMTYPFDMLPELLTTLRENNLDFLNTDRLTHLNHEAMTFSHVLGNWLLTTTTKVLFGWPFKDSQSGMWIFKRKIWDDLIVLSPNMPFSQELKVEAYAKGFKCGEAQIEYRPRVGDVKLSTFKDGVRNITHLFKKRLVLQKRRKSANSMA